MFHASLSATSHLLRLTTAALLSTLLVTAARLNPST